MTSWRPEEVVRCDEAPGQDGKYIILVHDDVGVAVGRLGISIEAREQTTIRFEANRPHSTPVGRITISTDISSFANPRGGSILSVSSSGCSRVLIAFKPVLAI